MFIKRIFFAFIIFIGFGALAYGADITVKAYVDNTTIALGQQFTLNVELSGKDASKADQPVTPALDFAQFLGSGSSQNISFVNGAMSSSKTINYHYQATVEGKHRIGSLKVSYKNETFNTDPIDVTVVNSGNASGQASQQPASSRSSSASTAQVAGDEISLVAEVSKRNVYPNEPVRVTYKLYTRVSITSLGLSQAPTTAGFWAEEIDMPGGVEQTTEVIKGVQYTVATVKKMVLFPTSAGSKTLGPMELICDVRAPSNRRDPFGNMFDDSFFFGRTVQKKVQSKPVNINVNPFPEDNKPNDFSGLSGQFSIQADIEKNQLKTNDAVTYKITVNGTGNINGIPEPKVDFPARFEIYPPKISQNINRTGNSITGSKTFEYVLVPRKTGTETIGSVSLSYFDTASKTYKTIQTKPVTLSIAQGEELQSALPSGLMKEEIQLLGRDIRFIKTTSPDFKRIHASVTGLWFWIVLVFPIIAIIPALLYRRHLDRMDTDIAYARQRGATHAAKKRLAAAHALLKQGKADAFYAEAGKALMKFLGDKLNIAEAGMITDEVKAILKDKGVNEEVSQTYFECLSHCDRMRFSPGGTSKEEMEAFLEKVETAFSLLDRHVKK